MRFEVPSIVRNPISLIGVAVTTAMAIVFVGLFSLETVGELRNPYLGLLLFVAVPALFLVGLLLIAVGVVLERRRSATKGPRDWPVFDLRVPHTRTVVFIVFTLTCVNLLIFSLAAYGGVHHMETAEFCGQTCHTAMEPEYTAFQVSPHARVACVNCHVGPGAGALVESKIAGTRQLWQLVSNNVPTPVLAPVHTMRPARDTCQACHWSEKFHGDKLRQIKEYADDEKSSETVTTLQIHIGGGNAATGIGTGIHWHMNINNKVEYIATDRQRLTIPWVRFTDSTGKVKEYKAEGVTDEQLAKGERRVMDCMDCHNRPAHTFEPSAERAIDNAIARGLIPRGLPFARKEAVAAVKQTYPNREAAMTGIDTRLRDLYKSKAADTVVLDRTIAGVQDVYSSNVFPLMKVDWGAYPNHIGHVAFPGCFRCHDDNHKAPDGATIKQDCESCHAMP